MEISVKQDIKKTKQDTDKINSSLRTCSEKLEEYHTSFTRENKVLTNDFSQITSNTSELKDNIKGDIDKQNKVRHNVPIT